MTSEKSKDILVGYVVTAFVCVVAFKAWDLLVWYIVCGVVIGGVSWLLNQL